MPVPEYEALDLTAACNAGLEVLDGLRTPPVGERVFHGIPFRIGPDEESSACFVVAEPGEPAREVPIMRRAERLLFVHRRLHEGDRRGGERDAPMPGTVVAAYAIRLEGHGELSLPLRERYEIGLIPEEGWDASSPFLTGSSNQLVLVDRDSGQWGKLGVRQCETVYPGLSDYLVLVWENSHPEALIESVSLRAETHRIVLAAITASNAGEHPFPTEAARTLVVTRRGPDGEESFVAPIVEVDRGVASYAYRLPSPDEEEYLEDPQRGWGEPAWGESPSAYVRVMAIPSATVELKDGEEELGQFRYGDLDYDRPLDVDRASIRIAEQGRNWVKVTVVDESTGRPVPCRIHFRSPDGIPYQPHGHHSHVNSDLDTWHIDIGGDVKLGRASYAYIDGTCEGWLPRGDLYVDIARGFEYEPLRRRIRIEPGQRELHLELRRWIDMNRQGWYSGDSHVHFLSAQGAVTEQAGEDLNVVNLLQSQWGSLFTNTEDFTGALLSDHSGRHVTWVGQENRQPFFGHMLLWGLKRPVMPWCTDGPNEAEMGAWHETTLSHWADRCHDQGGSVIIPHFPLPNGEPAALIATGRADAVEMIVQRRAFHEEYYGYLNCGYQVPLVGGTDKMSADVPVGIYRTYADLGDEEFGYDAWRAAVSAGRTFLSGGPILGFSVDGRQIGDTVRLSGPGTVSVSAWAESIFPIATLQLVHDGRVIAESESAGGTRRLELQAEVEVAENGWLAVRCGGPGYWDSTSHRGPWERGIFAHSSPIYVACGEGEWSRFDEAQARKMLALIEGGLLRVRAARKYPEDRITHHHLESDHTAYLEMPFLEAQELVKKRLGVE